RRPRNRNLCAPEHPSVEHRATECKQFASCQASACLSRRVMAETSRREPRGQRFFRKKWARRGQGQGESAISLMRRRAGPAAKSYLSRFAPPKTTWGSQGGGQRLDVTPGHRAAPGAGPCRRRSSTGMAVANGWQFAFLMKGHLHVVQLAF